MTLPERFHSSFVDIFHDPQSARLYADWKGYQSEQSIHQGCEQILQMMKRSGVDSILNDNSHVVGIWRVAANWVAINWFPRMRRAGLRRYAWVQSPSRMAQFSTKATVALMNTDDFGVRLFHEKAEAIAWLNHDHLHSDAAQKHRTRVMVIEDNSDFSELFYSMLYTMGCDPVMAGTGTTGFEMARRTAPDLIFCDIGLPGAMDGYQFAAAIRSNEKLWDIPLVAVSGQTNSAGKERARIAGFERMLLKPVKFADVREALATFSHGRPAERRILTKTGASRLLRRHYDRH